MRRGPARSWVLLVLLPLVGACFRYTATEPGGLAAGTPVRAHLAAPRDLFLGNLRIPQVVVTEGDLVRIDGDSAVISVVAVVQSDSSRSGTTRAVVWLPRAEVTRMEEKTLDRARSALAVGGIVAAGALLAESLLGGETTGGGPGRDPGGIAARIPLFRIAVP